MKYTESQFIKDNPCQEGFDDVKSAGFDFVSYWGKCPRPDWLLWLLEKNGIITVEQTLKLTAIFIDRTMQNYATIHPNDHKSAELVTAIKAYDLNSASISKSQIESLQKSSNGAFDCAGALQTGGVANTEPVRKAMASDLNYRMYGIDYHSAEYQSELEKVMADQANIVRSVIPNPFE